MQISLLMYILCICLCLYIIYKYLYVFLYYLCLYLYLHPYITSVYIYIYMLYLSIYLSTYLSMLPHLNLHLHLLTPGCFSPSHIRSREHRHIDTFQKKGILNLGQTEVESLALFRKIWSSFFRRSKLEANQFLLVCKWALKEWWTSIPPFDEMILDADIL